MIQYAHPAKRSKIADMQNGQMTSARFYSSEKSVFIIAW